MTVRSILVTGAGGALGSALVRAWQDRYHVIAASRTQVIRWRHAWIGDLTAPGAAAEAIEQAKPDLVLHAAAMTDVDACELDPAKAMKVNAEATGRLAAAARHRRAALIYISTEAVFDGERGGYRETDAPHPINQYAASKLAGEQEALSSDPGACVLRIGLEGWRPRGNPGFVQWVVESLRRGERRTICMDWIHTVVFASNLAEIAEKLWLAGATGLYHVGADKPASNWAIAQAAAQEFKLDASLLVPITSDQLRLRARRPKNVSLLSERLRNMIGPVVWNLRQGLAQMREQEMSGELRTLRELVLG